MPRAAISVATRTLHSPVLKAVQRGLTGVLALIAVDGDRVDALALEVADDAVCAVLRAAEHERVLHVRIAQDFRQQMLLVRLIDIIQGTGQSS